jgi:hypothetical protein
VQQRVVPEPLVLLCVPDGELGVQDRVGELTAPVLGVAEEGQRLADPQRLAPVGPVDRLSQVPARPVEIVGPQLHHAAGHQRLEAGAEPAGPEVGQSLRLAAGQAHAEGPGEPGERLHPRVRAFREHRDLAVLLHLRVRQGHHAQDRELRRDPGA